MSAKFQFLLVYLQNGTLYEKSRNLFSTTPAKVGISTAYSPPVLTPSINQLLMEGCHGGGPFSTA